MWDLFFNPLELSAVLAGIISAVLSWKKNIYTYFFGLISVAISVFLCYQAGIYADMAINIFYFLMSVYGWFNWHIAIKKDHTFVPLLLSKNKQFYFFMLTLFYWGIIYLILNFMTDSNIPVADSFTTAFFITGMILMALKYTENWIYLIIGNLVSVPLYIYKELYVYAFFFVILIIFGCLGYRSWRNHAKTNTP